MIDMANYKIIISGYYGFNNAGDEAMLFAILEALKKAYPSPDITVISGNPEITSKNFGVKAIKRFGIKDIITNIFKSNLIISGGGSLLQDVTSWKSMIYYLSIITLGVIFRKKVFLYSQGIGPVRYRIIRIILKHVLNHVSAITVRDKESKGFLERLGVHSKIYTTADAVLSLSPADPKLGEQILQRNNVPLDKKLIGVAIRSWGNTEHWTKELNYYLKKLQSDGDCNVVFIPMQYPEDYSCTKFLDQYDNVFVLKEAFNIQEIISLIGNLDLVVAMRLHALIFSSLMHVPFLGISYDPKIDNFLSLIDEKSVCNVTNMSATALYNETRDVLSQKKKINWDKIESLRNQACENVRVLKNVVR